MRIYTDTSVIGGCFDPEFEIWSKKLFKQFQEGIHIWLLSDIVVKELSVAPSKVQKITESVPKNNLETLSVNPETDKLAKLYIIEGALTSKSFLDAEHIALATIAKADLLVSWNFKHIVNVRRIRLFNGINLKNGYSMLEIRSPKEVVEDEEN